MTTIREERVEDFYAVVWLVVGHILFSRIQIETAADDVSAVSLAPMAVAA